LYLYRIHVAVKKLDDAGNIVNTTLTDLDVLKKIEKAFYNNNPEAMKRNTLASLDWFRKYIPRSWNNVRTSQVMRDRSLWTKKIEPGRLYFFEYNAINKETLPVWDAFPLVFFWDTFRSKEGKQILIGINLHYLSPVMRAAAMKELLKLKSNDRLNRNTKLKLSWDILKGLTNSKLFKHSVKMYRLDHVQTTFIEVPAASWEMAIFLPLGRMKKGGNTMAWNLKT